MAKKRGPQNRSNPSMNIAGSAKAARVGKLQQTVSNVASAKVQRTAALKKGRTTTMVMDIETSGLRAFMGTRQQQGLPAHRGPTQPPRITQFALSRIDHTGDKIHGKTLLVGAGPDRGYTDVIQKLVKKHNIQSPQNINEAFLQDLVDSGIYDRSVVIDDSLLNKQVKKHVKHMIQGGTEVKSATQHIETFMKSIDKALTEVDSVRVVAYNKGFDIGMMKTELGYTNPDLQVTFNQWLEKHVSSGKLQMVGGEDAVHRAVFERMLSNKKYIPEFTKSSAFDAAKSQAVKTGQAVAGTETLQKHHALRNYVNDITQMAHKRAAPEQIYAGLSSDLQEVFKNVKGKKGQKLWDEFKRVGDLLDDSPELKLELRNHYKRILKTTHGKEVAAHVIDMNKFDFTAGWRQEDIAEALGLSTKNAHDAVDDINLTWEIDRKLNAAHSGEQARETMARTMASTEYRQQIQQSKLERWLLEDSGVRQPRSGKAGTKLINESMRGSKWIARAAGKIKGNKGKLVVAAAAAAAMVGGDKLRRSLNAQHSRREYTAQFEGQLEGLRNPYGQYLQDHGIKPSQSMFGNVSAFGSGRNNFQDQELGFDSHPNMSMARRNFADQQRQRQSNYREAHQSQSLIPNQFKASDYAQNGLIDTTEWLIDMSNPDTAKMRRRWIDKDYPVLGNIFAHVQRMGIKMAESIGNKQFAENLFPSIVVRLSGVDTPIDLPTPLANQATDISEALMESSQYLSVDQGAATGGRYVGTFTGPSNEDINRNIVLWGGAMAAGQQYAAAQQTALAGGHGMLENLHHSGLSRNAQFSFNQGHSSMGNQTASLYNIAAWNMMRNNQLSGISDQRARNQHVFPTTVTDSSIPYNMGSLYS